MKTVIKPSDNRKVRFDSLTVGACFEHQRTGINEVGLYMIVDSHSGLASASRGRGLALNLETGQLRSVDCSAKVTPVDVQIVAQYQK